MKQDRLGTLHIAIDQGKHDEAIAELRRHLEAGADAPDVRRLLAYGLLKAGNEGEALENLSAARLAGTTADREVAFGRFLRSNGFPNAALRCFEAAVSLDRNNIDALALVSMTHRVLGHGDLARKTGQACLDAGQRDALAQEIDPLPMPKVLPEFDPAERGEHIIAYTLFGENAYYQDCALAAASQARAIYPEWTCRFYCSPDIPEEFIAKLKRLKAQIARVTEKGTDWKGLFWRFLAFDDPKATHVLVRDVDSPFTLRERIAVEEWLQSGYPFHAIRDHTNHLEPLMAGLWGGCTGVLPKMAPLIDKYFAEAKTKYADQHFLRRAIWPRIHNITLVHDRHFKLGETRRLPDHPHEPHIGFGLPRG